MTPHLVKWHEQYADRGLRVVEVSNGQMDSLDGLERHLVEEGIEFPVMHDTRGEVCHRFGVGAYPTALLVDREGKVLWHGHPFPGPNLEKRIEAALGST